MCATSGQVLLEEKSVLRLLLVLSLPNKWETLMMGATSIGNTQMHAEQQDRRSLGLCMTLWVQAHSPALASHQLVL
jgi:hypothetical protein